MKINYDTEEDILYIQFQEGKINKDISLGWNLNVGILENGSVGEMSVLDAKETGLFPIYMNSAFSQLLAGLPATVVKEN